MTNGYFLVFVQNKWMIFVKLWRVPSLLSLLSSSGLTRRSLMLQKQILGAMNQVICRLNHRDARSKSEHDSGGEMMHCRNISRLFFIRACFWNQLCHFSQMLLIMISIASLKAEEGIVTPEIPALIQKVIPDDLVKIKEFWNGLVIIKASIIQTNPDGMRLTGMLWLKKAKSGDERLRLDYQDDYKQRLIIKNNELFIMDLEEKSTAPYPLSLTPAQLLLKRPLNFDHDVKIIDSAQQGDDAQIVLVHPSDENAGRLVLFFNLKGGVRLLRWKVIDAHGNITEVELNQKTIQLNDPTLVPDSLF